MIGVFRALARLFFFTMVTACLIIWYWLVKGFYQEKRSLSIKIKHIWFRIVPPVMGLHIHLQGRFYDTPALYICNHRSYLDPVVILKCVDGRTLSKAEVSKWPLIGLAAEIIGTLFVKREHKGSRKEALEMMGKALASGESVINFPEGTTSAGPFTQSFRPASFELAADYGIPVVPVAIEYSGPEDAWVDDDTFLRHFFQIFSRARIDAYLHVGPSLKGIQADELLIEAKEWIDISLKQIRDQYWPAG